MDETYFLYPEGHWGQHPEHALQELQDGGGDAPAPAHEGSEERELPAALRGGRAAERLEDKPLCVPRQLAELLQLSVEEVCADFDVMLRPD